MLHTLTSFCIYVGIEFDAWGKAYMKVKYNAIYAIYDVRNAAGERIPPPLLAFAPLLNEESQSAPDVVDWIESTLKLYQKKLSDIAFTVTDNCNVMTRVGINKLAF